MKNLILVSLLSILYPLSSIHAASRAATEEWVRNYVRTNSPAQMVESETIYTQIVTNGYVTLIASNSVDVLTITGEIPNRLALVTTNCTSAAVSAGVTNHMYFAWNDAGVFTNAPAALAIGCTSSNFVFAGSASVQTNGVDSFPGLFDVRGIKIMPSMSKMLLGEEVSQ